MNMSSILFLAVVGPLIAPVQTVTVPPEPFQPPTESSLPDNTSGKMVRQGQALFVEARGNTPHLVDNRFNYVDCHLEQSRRAGSAPQWTAYPIYPTFRAKNNKVSTFAERLQGCFQFSMNGKVPAADNPEVKALTVYACWSAGQAPTEVNLPGRDYPDVAPSEGGYSIGRGTEVYAAQCAIYHGADDQGQMVLGQAVFPPLWGAQSLNWGAGMHCINTAASFIKYGIPLGRPGTLDDRDAWDIAAFMNSHERPQDPRLVGGSVEKTRQKSHTSDGVNLYGQKASGVSLGQGI